MVIVISAIFCNLMSKDRCVMHEGTHLSQKQVALRELFEHLLSAQCVVQLLLELVNLIFGVRQLHESRVILSYGYISAFSV